MEREMVSDVAQIYDVWKAYGSAVYEGDLNRWLALWIDDSKRLAPNAPASVGLEQIRIAVEPLFELFDSCGWANGDACAIVGSRW